MSHGKIRFVSCILLIAILFFRKYFGKYYGDDKRQGIFQSKFGNK